MANGGQFILGTLPQPHRSFQCQCITKDHNPPFHFLRVSLKHRSPLQILNWFTLALSKISLAWPMMKKKRKPKHLPQDVNVADRNYSKL
jgi:hypothetical protein